jgi:hypothetical protein
MVAPHHQVVLVERALLEAGRADVRGPARLDEAVHQIAQRGEALLPDVVGDPAPFGE